MLNEIKKISPTFRYLYKKGQNFFRKLKKFAKKYPFFIQFLQLSLLYLYASITLVFTVQNGLGMFPEFLERIIPFSKEILSLKFFRILASPEKTFFLYFILSEIVFRSKSISLFFQYNFLLVFLLEMIENLILALWDIFLRRDTIGMLPEELIIAQQLEISFFTVFFLIFFSIYIYCYINTLFLKFTSFPKPFEKITDSVCFWLNIDKKRKRKLN